MAKLAATTFHGLDRFLGSKTARTIGNNTTAERDAGAILVRLHGHHIVTVERDESVAFNLAGWNTVTTRDRVNSFILGKVSTRKGQAFLTTWSGGVEKVQPIESSGWIDGRTGATFA